MKYSLERITTEFSNLEDRITLVSRVHGQGAITIFITRRMLSLMLPTLFEQVSGGGASRFQLKAQIPASDAAQVSGYESLRQEFAQLAANEQLSPTLPVKAEVDGVTILPYAVDFKLVKNLLVLIFRDEGDTMATLALDDIQLRQWLQMLYKCGELQGRWQLALWPAWLVERNLARAPQGLAVH